MDQSVDHGAATRSANDHSIAYDGGKPPHEIETDIARTRVRLSAAIEALERELAPGRVIEKSAEALRSSLEPRPGSFREQARAYAIPLALIVTGLGWLFVLRRRNYQADLPSNSGATAVDAVEAAEAPSPAPRYDTVTDPVEPVSLVDEKTAV
jgi:hypothetical protein